MALIKIPVLPFLSALLLSFLIHSLNNPHVSSAHGVQFTVLSAEDSAENKPKSLLALRDLTF